MKHSAMRLAITTGVVALLTAQSTNPVLNPATQGSSSVTGKAVAGGGPITVYNTTFTPRTKIGESNSMDKDGNFAVAVTPPLIRNHRLVAVDKAGRTSADITVGAAPLPAGPK